MAERWEKAVAAGSPPERYPARRRPIAVERQRTLSSASRMGPYLDLVPRCDANASRGLIESAVERPDPEACPAAGLLTGVWRFAVEPDPAFSRSLHAADGGTYHWFRAVSLIILAVKWSCIGYSVKVVVCGPGPTRSQAMPNHESHQRGSIELIPCTEHRK